ncbi:MAG: hypothetical protein ACI4DY_09605 [Monoglobaceae bacterium]
MEAVIGVIVCFFAIYGVFSILYDCIEKAAEPKKTAQISVHRVLFVGKEAGDAEAYLRCAALKEDLADTIIISCFDGEEEERALKLLTSQFGFAACMTVKEYTAFVNKETELIKHRCCMQR